MKRGAIRLISTFEVPPGCTTVPVTMDTYSRLDDLDEEFDVWHEENPMDILVSTDTELWDSGRELLRSGAIQTMTDYKVCLLHFITPEAAFAFKMRWL